MPSRLRPMTSECEPAVPPPALPDVFVVGAAKSGTTAIYRYFRAHPQVFVSPTVKEANYMAFGGVWPPMDGPGDRRALANSAVEYAVYQDLFRDRAVGQLAADVSPAYFYHPAAAQRIVRLCPRAKIVVVLRNPIEAAFSMFAMMRRDGREPCRNFWTAFGQSARRQKLGWEWAWDYEGCFRLARQLARYLTLFPSEQLWIRPYDLLAQDPERFYAELTGFLGVRRIELAGANPRVNAAPTHRDMLARTRAGRLLVKAARVARRVLPPAACEPIARRMASTALHLNAENQRRLAEVYRAEIFEIERLLSWDLRAWMKV